jgi:hypothetical protein
VGGFARTIAADGGTILTNGTQTNVGITNFLDINKNNSVSVAADRGPILTAGTGVLSRISITSAGPFAPLGGDAGGAGIASALAIGAGAIPRDDQDTTATSLVAEPSNAREPRVREVPASERGAALAAAWHSFGNKARGSGPDLMGGADEDLLSALASWRLMVGWRQP